MKLDLEKVKSVFVQWNKECLADEDKYDAPLTKEMDVESYSERQAKEFLEVYKKVHGEV